MTSKNYIKAQQHAWAEEIAVQFDQQDYCCCIPANLQIPMCDETRQDFLEADGAELIDTHPIDGRPRHAKMRALHSSSALAVNTFEYWRQTGRVRDIAAMLHGAGRYNHISFERKFPNGIRGKDPNLDVVISDAYRHIIAVESKFIEPYSGGTKPLEQSYVDADNLEVLWHGLPNCYELATLLNGPNHGFIRLDVAQLLRHIIGLVNGTEGVGIGRFTLICLWYNTGLPDAAKHQDDLLRFAEIVQNDGIDFRHMSYQALFAQFPAPNNDDPNYVQYHEYLRSRYFTHRGA